MRTGCVPAGNQVAFFDRPNFAGACVIVAIGNHTEPTAGGVPNDWVGSVVVGAAAKVTAWADGGFSGTSNGFAAATMTAAVPMGDNQVSSYKVMAGP